VYLNMPWRAPGSAVRSDPCGVAGGNAVKQPNGGEYNPTQFAKQGDLGSQLPPQLHGVVWRAGSVVEASVFIKANHGGGWQYRLCPLPKQQQLLLATNGTGELSHTGTASLTEECFQQHVLPFAGATQVLRYTDGTEQAINATFVTSGTVPANSTWIMNPVPECCPPDGACEKQAFTCGSSLSSDCYSHECGTKTTLGVSAPDFPWPASNPSAQPTNLSPRFSVVDFLQVPDDITPGDWVLQWRWDAGESAFAAE
jgi:hypothetical protein